MVSDGAQRGCHHGARSSLVATFLSDLIGPLCLLLCRLSHCCRHLGNSNRRLRDSACIIGVERASHYPSHAY